MKAKSGESLLSGNIKYIVDLIITPPHTGLLFAL